MLETQLSRTPLVVTAPTTEAAVLALLQHFRSFFGGEPYEPKDAVDAVIIQPPGEFGLLANEGSWKRCATIQL